MLYESTFAVFVAVIQLSFTLDECIEEKFVLEAFPYEVGLHNDLGILTEFVDLFFWNEDFPAASDPLAKLADEQSQRS